MLSAPLDRLRVHHGQVTSESRSLHCLTWSDGGYGFLAVKPAFFPREVSFFMGVKASAGWPAGVYRGVVVEGKGKLKI
jgi:hypothetical protein